MIENIHKTPCNGLNENAFSSVNLNLKVDPDENDATIDHDNSDFLAAALKCETSMRKYLLILKDFFKAKYKHFSIYR